MNARNREIGDSDVSGEGLAWHDINPGNIGGYYRLDSDTDVDIARDDTGG